VQVLRQGRTLDLHGRLVAESLAYATLQAGPEFARWLAGRSRAVQRPHAAGPSVRVRREGARLCLTLDRAARHNAFDARMRDELAEGLALVLADDSIEEVVLDGAGPSFCSGGDLDEFGSFPDPATAHAVRSARSPARLLALCAARARAEVHGACIGAGCELPAFCRHVRARADAFFQLPEVGMGLVPGAGGTASLPERIGRQRTAWLALSGRRIDAPTALSWGLVDAIAG
jgi:enoyl-CoA hydratase/carnithine racemase